MTHTWKSLILAGALLTAIVPANAGVRFFVGPVYRPYWGYPPPYYGRVYSVAPQHAHSGQLKLDTRDRDAQVYLDGAYAGKVRDVNSAWLPEGNHELEVRGTNGATFDQQIHVLAGRTLAVHPDLIPANS